jgi:hypothetical protein
MRMRGSRKTRIIGGSSDSKQQRASSKHPSAGSGGTSIVSVVLVPASTSGKSCSGKLTKLRYWYYGSTSTSTSTEEVDPRS